MKRKLKIVLGLIPLGLLAASIHKLIETQDGINLAPNKFGVIWSVYICCDKIIQPEMFKFELWQRSMKMNLRF